MPKVLEKSEEYQVKKGDTLESIVKEKCPDLDWKVLARYNWATDQPREVIRAMAETVGIKVSDLLKVGLIANPEKIKFDPDKDLPSTKIKIPKVFEKDGLALEKTHTIKVQCHRPANAVGISELDKWFIPEAEACAVNYQLEGEDEFADKVQVDVFGSKYCDCTDWNKGLGTYGAALDDEPIYTKDLAEQNDERQAYGLPDEGWKGQTTTTKGILGRKTGKATERYINVAFSPYTVQFRYWKNDKDKDARLALEPFWVQFDETKTEPAVTTTVAADKITVKWTNAAVADRGVLRITDKKGQLVHLAELPEDKLAEGAKEIDWDKKYRVGIINSNFGDSYLDDSAVTNPDSGAAANENAPYTYKVTTIVVKPKADSLKIKWKIKKSGGKLQRGLLLITDKEDKLIFQKPLARSKLSDGDDDKTFVWDGKYSEDIKNSKAGDKVIPADQPYRVQIQVNSGIDQPEAVALSAMHTEVRLYVHPKAVLPRDLSYDPVSAKQSLKLGLGPLVPDDPPTTGTLWYRHKLAEYGFHPGPITEAAAADEEYKIAMLEFKRSVPEKGIGIAAPNFKRLEIVDGTKANEENPKAKTAIENCRPTDKRSWFGKKDVVAAGGPGTPDLTVAEVATILPDPSKEIVVWIDERQYYTQDQVAGGGKDENNHDYLAGNAEADAFGLLNYRGNMFAGDSKTEKDEKSIPRPWIPLKIDLVLLSRSQGLDAAVDVNAIGEGTRKAMRRACGPLRVDWHFDELNSDLSVIDPAMYDHHVGRSRKYVAWVIEQNKAQHTRKDTSLKAIYTNCPESLGGIRPGSLATYYKTVFGLDDLSLAPWRATEDSANESVVTVVHDHIAAAQKNKGQAADATQVNLYENLIGSAGAYFHPSRIAGDGYRVRADVQFKKFTGYAFPNLEVLDKRYPVTPQAHSAALRNWRRASIRGYMSWAAAESGNWPGYLDDFRKHYRAAHVYFTHEGGSANRFRITEIFNPADTAHKDRYKNLIHNNLTKANLKNKSLMTLKRDFIWPWDDQRNYGYPDFSAVNMNDGDVYQKFLSDKIMEETWGIFSQTLLFALLKEVEKRGSLRGHLLVEFKSSGKFHLREYKCDGNEVPAGSTPAPPHTYWACEKGDATDPANNVNTPCPFPNCKRVEAGPPVVDQPSALSETTRCFEYDKMPLWAEGRAMGATWLFNTDTFPAIWTHEVGHHRQFQHAADAPGAVLNLHDSEDNEAHYPPPLIAFTVSVDTGNAALRVTFTDTSTGNPTHWLWDFGDGAFSTVKNPVHTFRSPGTYEVELTVRNVDRLETKKKTITVTGDALTATMTAAVTSGLAPLSLRFVDDSTGGIHSRTWLFGDGGSDTVKDPIHVYDKPGSHELRLIVNSDKGVAIATKTITVTPPTLPLPTGLSIRPYPTAKFSASVYTGNAPLTVSFKDKSLFGPTNWLWDFGDGAISILKKPTHTFVAPGTYNVKLRVKNGRGQSKKEYTKTITVGGVSAVPVASFTTTTTAGTAPLDVAFTDTSSGSPTAWYWLFGDGTASLSRSPVHTFEVPGTHKVWLNARNAYGDNWVSLDIVVDAPIVPDTPAALQDRLRLQWDRRCIMGYSHMFNENEEYFCGKCILRNRGWKVTAIGPLGKKMKEP